MGLDVLWPELKL